MAASNRLAAAMMTGICWLAPAAAQNADVVGGEAALVTVNVLVTDYGKRPIAGLRDVDFLVSDGGRTD